MISAELTLPNGDIVKIDMASSELLGKWLEEIFKNMHWVKGPIPLDYRIRIFPR